MLPILKRPMCQLLGLFACLLLASEVEAEMFSPQLDSPSFLLDPVTTSYSNGTTWAAGNPGGYTNLTVTASITAGSYFPGGGSFGTDFGNGIEGFHNQTNSLVPLTVIYTIDFDQNIDFSAFNEFGTLELLGFQGNGSVATSGSIQFSADAGSSFFDPTVNGWAINGATTMASHGYSTDSYDFTSSTAGVDQDLIFDATAGAQGFNQLVITLNYAPGMSGEISTFSLFGAHTVPEPGSLFVILAAGLSFLVRRRRSSF